MRLVMTKNQSKGMLGGVSFEVSAQVQLTEPERQLVTHYKLGNEVLLSKPMVNIWGQPTNTNMEVRLTQLVQGTVYKCKDLSEVITFSENVKNACITLRTYLAVASTFGGQEVIDFDAQAEEGEAS